MGDVSQFINKHQGEQHAILVQLDAFFCDFPGVYSHIRYQVPFYFRHSRICYLSPKKDGRVELVFIRARELFDEHKLLNFKDRKQLAGITYLGVSDIHEQELQLFFNQALLLDESG